MDNQQQSSRRSGEARKHGARRGRHHPRPRLGVLHEALEGRQLLTTIYVDTSSPAATPNGTSWATAYADLQQALAAAVSGDQIRVADGTYRPTTTTSRTATFSLKTGVTLSGGYAGYGAPNPDARDVGLYPSVLSGDIGAAGNAADNSLHVVSASGTSSTAVLDGFTVTAGNANTIATGSIGGGLYVSSGGVTVRNCSFVANAATSGGAVYGAGSSSTFTNSTFVANAATNSGGAFYILSSAPVVTNCTLVANTAGVNGGAAYLSSSGAFTNCIFWNNAAPNGGQIYNPNSASVATYCDVQGGLSGTGNVNADPVFVRAPAPGPDGVWRTADDDYGDLRISAASPVVDAGSNPAATGLTTDLAGSPRFQNVPTTADTGSGTAPVVDVGAYEASPALAASAGGPYVVVQGQPLTLAGRGASNVAGTLQYAWEWTGDGLFNDATGTSPVFPSGSFGVGSVTVSLRVTDSAGHSTVGTAVVQVAPQVLYVDWRATTGARTGYDWANALTTLPDTLAAALPGQTIRVAAGTFKPTTTTDRSQSFALRNNVAVFGGYAGNAEPAAPDTRDLTLYPSILSGDIGTAGSATDNSYHVVVGSGTTSTAVLDGFTVAAGNAGGSAANAQGGGLYVSAGSPTVRNCRFVANSATSAGGAVFDTGAAPTFVNCAFLANSAVSGGAVHNAATSPATFAGCWFVGNAATSGGAVYNDASAPTIVNCTFTANAAGTTAYGGAIYNTGSAPKITNTVLWADAAGAAPEIYNTGSSAPVVTYSDVRGEYAGSGNLDADPFFARPASPGPDGAWRTADDDYGDLRPSPVSPVVDAGSNAAVPASLTTDASGGPRTRDVSTVPDTGQGTAPVVDLGAYEAAPALVVSAGGPYVVFVGHDATLGGRAATDAAAGAFLYEWDLDNDGTFGDATGPSVTFPAAGLAAGSVRTVGLRATDAAGHSVAATTTVRVAPQIVYVDPRASGDGSGSDWADAMVSLADALSLAVPGQQIRVATGVYRPTTTADRGASFTLRSGVSLYGGYAGLTNPASPDTRAPAMYPTTLSGDIGTPGSAGDNSYHVLVASGVDATAVLDGFRITAGNASGAGTLGSGGGLLAYSGSPTLSNCTFASNSAASGGAIYVDGGGPAVTSCIFTGNVGTSAGGAVYDFNASPKFTNCVFVANTAVLGGVFYNNAASPTLVNCTLTANAATNGGAMYNIGSPLSPTVVNCILWGDTATNSNEIYGAGGSVTYSDVQGGYGGTADINANPLFTRSPSPGPDGAWRTADDDYGDLTPQSNSPAIDVGRNASVPAGVLTDLAGRPRLTDVPSTPNGGGGWVDLGAHELPVTPVVAWMTQTSVRRYEDAGTYAIPIQLSSYSDVPITIPVLIAGGPSSAGNYAVPASVTIPAGQSTGSLVVSLLDDHQAQTPETITISLGTPDNAVVIAPSAFTLTVVDNDLLYVDPAAAGGRNDGSSWADAFTDLQAALAKAPAGGVVRVAKGTYKPTTYTSSASRTVSFQLKTGVGIYGGYAGSASTAPDARDVAMYPSVLSGAISGVGGTSNNSYHVVVGSGTDATAVLDGFTITGGNANNSSSGGEANDYGAGMYNLHGSPTVRSCTFTGNTSTYGGGAVYNSGSSPTFTNCTFSNNSSSFYGGGAIYNIAASSPVLTGCSFLFNVTTAYSGAAVDSESASAPVIVNCTFIGNVDQGGYGGALAFAATGRAVVAGCLFVANSAYAGGAISVSGSSPSIVNCTFVANDATQYGGAIYASGGSGATITNSILWGNTAIYGNEFYTAAGAGPAVSRSDVQDGYAGTGNVSADPLFDRLPSPGPDGVWRTADDDYGDLRISSLSLAVDAGDNGALPATLTTDLAGAPRFLDVPTTSDIGVGTAPVVDIGAYEATATLGAHAGGPYTVFPGQFLTLHGLGSSDAPGSLQFAWDWTSDGLFDDASGPTPSFPVSAYPVGTTLAVRLRVTDSLGRSVTSAPSTIRIAPVVVYVDPHATGNGGGADWSNAFTSLADALALAVSGQTFRVATGTYAPTPTTDRTASFQLKDGVALYGGYAGLSLPAAPDTRNPALYPATLSGDIGIPGDNSDNSYHVVTGSGTDATAIIDGFTIANGNASTQSSLITGGGGGLFNFNGSPTVNNCTFVSNNAVYYGGAVYNNYANPAITNCSFLSNTAGLDGGAIFGKFSTSAITGCSFAANSSQQGGGIFNWYASTTITNCSFTANAGAGAGVYNFNSVDTRILCCTFYANYSRGDGGAIYNSASGIFPDPGPTTVIANCVFVANLADVGGGGAVYAWTPVTLVACTLVANSSNSYGGAFYNYSGSSLLVDCILWANTAALNGQQIQSYLKAPIVTCSDVQGGYTGIGNISADPLFARNPSPGPDGVWRTADDDFGDLRLTLGAPCVDAGSNAALPASLTTDLGGQPRTFDFPGAGPANTAAVDMGAFELGPALGTLTIPSGQTLHLPAGGHTFSVKQLSLGAGATLDVADDTLILDNATPVATLRSYLAAARGGGTWTGAGVTSSSAAGTTDHALGYALASDVGVTTFSGKPVDPAALLLKYTYYGDANLDGRVNADDYALTDRGLARGGAAWTAGDFDYSGTVDAADYQLLDQHAAGSPSPSSPLTTPPPPPDAVVPSAATPALAPTPAAADKSPHLTLAGATRVRRGQSLRLSVASGGPAGRVRYAIDWDGNGTIDRVVTGNATGLSVSRRYARTGVFNVLVTILDPAGRRRGKAQGHRVRVV